MFKELGAIMKLMNNKDALQAEMGKFQHTLGTLFAEGTAGGLVTVRVNGRMEILGCRFADGALTSQDKGLLEDLVVAATNQALNKVREQVAAETAKMAQNLGLPPGMLGGLPGLS